MDNEYKIISSVLLRIYRGMIEFNSEDNYQSIHLIKIDNETIKPTDYQQLCQRSVGLLVPKLCHRHHDGNIRCLEPVAPFAPIMTVAVVNMKKPLFITRSFNIRYGRFLQSHSSFEMWSGSLFLRPKRPSIRTFLSLWPKILSHTPEKRIRLSPKPADF